MNECVFKKGHSTNDKDYEVDDLWMCLGCCQIGCG